MEYKYLIFCSLELLRLKRKRHEMFLAASHQSLMVMPQVVLELGLIIRK